MRWCWAAEMDQQGCVWFIINGLMNGQNGYWKPINRQLDPTTVLLTYQPTRKVLGRRLRFSFSSSTNLCVWPENTFLLSRYSLEMFMFFSSRSTGSIHFALDWPLLDIYELFNNDDS